MSRRTRSLSTFPSYSTTTRPNRLREDNATSSADLPSQSALAKSSTTDSDSSERESSSQEESDFVVKKARTADYPFFFTSRKVSSDPPTAGQYAKQLVDTLDPNKGLCVLTQHNNFDTAVQYCHLLPQCARSDHTMLTSLEWAWGMRYFTLNVDEPTNIIKLKVDFHILLDRGSFILLPSGDVVDQFYHREFPSLPHPSDQPLPIITDVYKGETTFEYRLVPLDGMAGINRAYRAPNSSPTLSARFLADEVLHRYPTGGKIEVLKDSRDEAIAAWNEGGFAGTDETEVVRALKRVENIYLSWIGRNCPADFTIHREELSADDSERTDESDLDKRPLKRGRSERR
ncbi:hypothetical protein EW146_g2488 [Bondarzewia mesenterica]|uniref:HNH nuclease domain-containing protein n=1 Tax=Bondarzewia mesenterica TaxID=1095465 RepID=A0A4V3XFR0_9AGAM|nr:hypothetical protein EW146_g2488 [Bondarzewia mesenterica]